MSYIIHDVEQGTPEWHQVRAGSITASMFGQIMDKLTRGPDKGGYRKPIHDYAFRLAIERISGEPLDEGMFENYAMRRGHELEPEARAAHAFLKGLDIERAGFVTTEDGLFGASADGLIGEEGGSEYKCLIDPARIRDIVLNRDISEFAPQCQGGMWLTGRKWWHFCLYCPALQPAGKDLMVFPVERDEEYIERMESELVAFNRLVEDYRARILQNKTGAE